MDKKNNSAKGFKLATISIYVLGVIHIILLSIASGILEGHEYGPADKYGDHARGLTFIELDNINTLIPILVGIILVMGIIMFAFVKVNTPIIGRDEAGKKTGPMVIPAFICIFGTIWTLFEYSMYH